MIRKLISEVLPPSERLSRWVIGILGILHLGQAYYTTQLPYASGWWACLFVGAALGCLVYSVTLHRLAAVYAGAFTISAFIARGGLLVVERLRDYPMISDAQMWSGLIAWTVMLLGWGPVFFRVTVPFAYREHIRHSTESG